MTLFIDKSINIKNDKLAEIIKFTSWEPLYRYSNLTWYFFLARERNLSQLKSHTLIRVVHNLFLQIKKFKLVLWPQKNKTNGIITEGVLAVKYEGGKAGVVCSDNWDLKEMRVACGELGFTHAVQTTTHTSIDQVRKIYS